MNDNRAAEAYFGPSSDLTWSGQSEPELLCLDEYLTEISDDEELGDAARESRVSAPVDHGRTRATTPPHSEVRRRVLDPSQVELGPNDARPGRSVSSVPASTLARLDLSLDGYLAARGPLPIVEAVDLALAMCDRVTPLHSGNSPYRELSIDAFWVMRTPEGGIALDCERPLATLHSSPRFEAPELRSAPDRVDHRADIWSLGAILYELLVGYGPEGDLRSRATLSLAPRTLSALLEARRFLPSALAETVYACLEEQPWRRPQTISDLTALLMPFSSRRERHSRSAQDSESIASTWLGHPAPHLAAVLLLGAASPAAPKPVTTPDDKSKSTRPTIPPPSRARSVQARTPTLYTLAPGASAPWLPPALVVDAPAEEFVRLRRRASVYSTQHLAIRARVADGSAGSVPSDPRSSYAQVPAVESRPPKGTNAQLDHAPWFWAVAIAVSIGAAVATALAAQALESGNGSGLVHSHR